MILLILAQIICRRKTDQSLPNHDHISFIIALEFLKMLILIRCWLQVIGIYRVKRAEATELRHSPQMPTLLLRNLWG